MDREKLNTLSKALDEVEKLEAELVAVKKAKPQIQPSRINLPVAEVPKPKPTPPAAIWTAARRIAP